MANRDGIFLILSLSVIILSVCKLYFTNFHPVAVFVSFFVGLLWGEVSLWSSPLMAEGTGFVVSAPQNFFYILFVPVILTLPTFTFNFRHVQQNYRYVLFVSLLSYTLQVVVITVITTFIFKWNWPQGALVGSCLSMTSFGASLVVRNFMTHVTETSSSIMDCMALLEHCISGELWIILNITESPSVGMVILQLIYKLLISIAIGYTVSAVVIQAVKKCKNDWLTEMSIIISFIYLLFYIMSSVLNLNGICALIVFCLNVSYHRHAITARVNTMLLALWEFLFYASHVSIVFCGAILLRVEATSNISGSDGATVILIILAGYALRNLVCAALPYASFLATKKTEKSFDHPHSILLATAPSRSVVGLGIALSIRLNPAFESLVSSRILFHVIIVTVFSHIIMEPVLIIALKRWNMLSITAVKLERLRRIYRYLRLQQNLICSVLHSDAILAGANWELAILLTADSCSFPYHGISIIPFTLKHSLIQFSNITEQIQLKQELMRLRLVYRFKSCIKEQHEKGILFSRKVMRELFMMADKALEEQGSYISPEIIRTLANQALLERQVDTGNMSFLKKQKLERFQKKVRFIYELIFAFRHIQLQVLRTVSTFVVDDIELSNVKLIIENSIESVLVQLQPLEEIYGDLILAAKTKHVSRQILNTTFHHSMLALNEGLMSSEDFTLITTKLRQCNDRLYFVPLAISNCNPLRVLKSLWWYQQESPDIQSLLVSNIELKQCAPQTVLLQKGEVCTGLCVIGSGIVKAEYDDFHDYSGTGNVVNIYGVLTITSSTYRLVAQTQIEMVFIPAAFVREIIRKSSLLAMSFWQVFATRMAFVLLKKELGSQYNDTDLYFLCEKGSLFNIPDENKLILKNEYHYVLIHGEYVVERLDEEGLEFEEVRFQSPCIIHETLSIKFAKDSKMYYVSKQLDPKELYAAFDDEKEDFVVKRDPTPWEYITSKVSRNSTANTYAM